MFDLRGTTKDNDIHRHNQYRHTYSELRRFEVTDPHIHAFLCAAAQQITLELTAPRYIGITYVVYHKGDIAQVHRHTGVPQECYNGDSSP